MEHFNFSFIIMYTKTLVRLLLCIVTFTGQPQGLPVGPRVYQDRYCPEQYLHHALC
jgi:hypothetical protein